MDNTSESETQPPGSWSFIMADDKSILSLYFIPRVILTDIEVNGYGYSAYFFSIFLSFMVVRGLGLGFGVFGAGVFSWLV